MFGVGLRAFYNVSKISGYFLTIRTIDNRLDTLVQQALVGASHMN